MNFLNKMNRSLRDHMVDLGDYLFNIWLDILEFLGIVHILTVEQMEKIDDHTVILYHIPPFMKYYTNDKNIVTYLIETNIMFQSASWKHLCAAFRFEVKAGGQCAINIPRQGNIIKHFYPLIGRRVACVIHNIDTKARTVTMIYENDMKKQKVK